MTRNIPSVFKSPDRLFKYFEPTSIRARTVVGGALLVAVLEYATHLLISELHAPVALNAVIDAAVIAAFTGVLLGVVVAAAHMQRRMVAKEMQTVAELNHHVRNALQVIRESHRLPTERQTEAVIESVDRIDKTLKTLFPSVAPARMIALHPLKPSNHSGAKSISAAAIAKIVLSCVVAAQAQNVTSPMTSTTLAMETGNNTSAADTFAMSVNGNISARNVSKLPLRDLLYDHADTKIYAHFVGWFGGRDHIDIGYQSADSVQVQKQVADMISRGIDGVIIDWYGPKSSNRFATAVNTELATEALMSEAERLGGFEFAIMIDKGALGRCRHDRCDATAELIRQMTYVHDTYQNSPAYMHVNGRPVVLFFGIDREYKIDWERVVRHVPGSPVLVFQDAHGFSNPLSNSGYAWVKLNREKRRDWMRNYLQYFYRSGKRSGQDTNVIGAVYKGFDDSVATWSENRVMSQDCGRTWLRTWAEIAEEHSPTEPLKALQLVTWNDYEEGTEIETGIDNCVALKAWRSGASVRWHVDWSSAKHADLEKNGPEEMVNGIDNQASQLDDSPEVGIDHFAIFVSPDQRTLSQVAEVPVGQREFNVASLNLGPGVHYFYVKAVGKPGLLNHMSGAITVTGSR
jgi:hypothetical protein